MNIFIISGNKFQTKYKIKSKLVKTKTEEKSTPNLNVQKMRDKHGDLSYIYVQYSLVYIFRSKLFHSFLALWPTCVCVLRTHCPTYVFLLKSSFDIPQSYLIYTSHTIL